MSEKCFDSKNTFRKALPNLTFKAKKCTQNLDKVDKPILEDKD